MMNGRKMQQSMCIVGHKPFEGRGENQIINEATGIVLFPTGIRKNILEKFINEKLSFSKEEAHSMLYDNQWYRYDWLFISHRSSTPFIITQERIKLYP